MVVLKHKPVGGKKDSKEKTWVEKIAELGRRRWGDQDIDEVFGTMFKDACHDGQHPRTKKCREVGTWNMENYLQGTESCRSRHNALSLLQCALMLQSVRKRNRTLALGGRYLDVIVMIARNAMRKY